MGHTSLRKEREGDPVASVGTELPHRRLWVPTEETLRRHSNILPRGATKKTHNLKPRAAVGGCVLRRAYGAGVTLGRP